MSRKENMVNTAMLRAKSATSLPNVVRQAFTMIRKNRELQVTIAFTTTNSSGKIIVNRHSKYDRLIRAFQRAENHTGEFADNSKMWLLGLMSPRRDIMKPGK